MTTDRTILIKSFIQHHKLAEPIDAVTLAPLDGGVSSDIWHVKTPSTEFCVKAALPKLKVAADWFAPIERNTHEVNWLNTANKIIPGIAPEVLAVDNENGLFAMAYLPSSTHPVWKNQLKLGTTDASVAASLGNSIAKLHGATENDPVIQQMFKTDQIFHAIRLEPYLEAVAEKHPDLAGILNNISSDTANNRKTLVHGDISPKNILVGPQGPVILDAECAWYGDPAFDIAFCLNHLLLKCLWKPDYTGGYLQCFDALEAGYRSAYDGDDSGIESRAATLLPGLLLGRVDGRSPVEYLTAESDKNLIRKSASKLLKAPVSRLADIRDHWHKTLHAKI
jgi:fructosamine-3-kinase